MNSVNTQLDLLLDVLKKKNQYLQHILTYTSDQTTLLQKSPDDLEGFNKLVQKKDVFIDQILLLDEGFEVTYNKVSNFLQNQPDLYQEKILEMKQLITDIGEKDISIKVQEERNKLLISKFHIEKPFQQNKNTYQVANYYARMKRSRGGNDPTAIDSKK